MALRTGAGSRTGMHVGSVDFSHRLFIYASFIDPIYCTRSMANMEMC